MTAYQQKKHGSRQCLYTIVYSAAKFSVSCFSLYFFPFSSSLRTVGTLACSYQFSATSSQSKYFTDVLVFFLPNFCMCIYICAHTHKEHI